MQFYVQNWNSSGYAFSIFSMFILWMATNRVTKASNFNTKLSGRVAEGQAAWITWFLIVLGSESTVKLLQSSSCNLVPCFLRLAGELYLKSCWVLNDWESFEAPLCCVSTLWAHGCPGGEITLCSQLHRLFVRVAEPLSPVVSLQGVWLFHFLLVWSWWRQSTRSFCFCSGKPVASVTYCDFVWLCCG